MQILSQSEVSGDYTIKLIGEFDAHGCREIREQLDNMALSCGQKKLSVDMKDVSFIDSSGVGAIVFLFKRIRATGGNMCLINVHSQPQELLSLLRVHEAITVQPLSSSPNESVA